MKRLDQGETAWREAEAARMQGVAAWKSDETARGQVIAAWMCSGLNSDCRGLEWGKAARL
ncbi:hypothetical protein Hanom_Chr14g01249121 [Helianthus anomalus]